MIELLTTTGSFLNIEVSTEPNIPFFLIYICDYFSISVIILLFFINS